MTGRLIAIVGVVGFSLLGSMLGGCQEAKLKDDVARLQGENDSLKTEKQALIQELAARDTRNPVTPINGPKDRNWDPQNKNGSKLPQLAETRIEVAGDKLFGPGSVSIMAAGKAELDKVASRIKREFPGASIRVEGYTDTDPPNKIKKLYPTNEALSLARAQEVEKYLASKGVASGQLEAVGMGAARPKATKAASRRVEIVVIGA